MTDNRPGPDFIRKEPHVGQRCVHCQRECGNFAGGFARFTGLPVCSKPSDQGRPDCYRMITMKFHPIRNCPECMDTTPYEYPPQPRGSLGRHGI